MSQLQQFNGKWNYPTTVHFGCDKVKELPRFCRKANMLRPLLVTDPGLRALPMIEDIIQHNLQNDIITECFSHIKSNPTAENVTQGVMAFRNAQCDGVIAIGGGSALDAGKAIALMVGQTRPIWDFEDIGDNYLRVNVAGMMPVIAIPTTAGTGSEVGRASVILDDATHCKKIIFHPNMLPHLVIADPVLCVGLSKKLTAATGMDALSHNLEAYCAPGFHPMADGIALLGIRLVKENLPQAVLNGKDLIARSNMLAASSMGATAFQKGLGAMHALAHPLGAVYDAHHGMLNAILMPYVLQNNLPDINEKLQKLAHFLDLPVKSANAVIDWILQLRSEIGIPETLSSIGIDMEQVDLIANMAIEDPSAATNPKILSQAEYLQLLLHAIRGHR